MLQTVNNVRFYSVWGIFTLMSQFRFYNTTNASNLVRFLRLQSIQSLRVVPIHKNPYISVLWITGNHISLLCLLMSFSAFSTWILANWKTFLSYLDLDWANPSLKGRRRSFSLSNLCTYKSDISKILSALKFYKSLCRQHCHRFILPCNINVIQK